MKRDMNLVRAILLHFEDRDSFALEDLDKVKIGKWKTRAIKYHVDIMSEAGLLSSELQRSSSTPERLIRALPFRLTWEGHEFLDLARSNTTWRKALRMLKTAGVGATRDVLVPLLVTLGKQQLGIIG